MATKLILNVTYLSLPWRRNGELWSSNFEVKICNRGGRTPTFGTVIGDWEVPDANVDQYAF